MRTFDPRTIAAAMDSTPKKLSNLLSRIEMGAVAKGRQGRRRRIETGFAQELDLIAQLERFGVPSVAGRSLAKDLIHADEPREIHVGAGLTLLYDQALHIRDLEARLRAAAEKVVPHRRGRPRQRAHS